MRIENFFGLKAVSRVPEEMDGTAIGQAKPELGTVLGHIADMIVDASAAEGLQFGQGFDYRPADGTFVRG